MGIMVDDVHTLHVKGPTGTLVTQSLVFKDGTTVDFKCKSTLMTFNTIVPTMKEVDNLPKYQIAFTEWEPQRYYDDSYRNHQKLNQDKEDSNTLIFIEVRYRKNKDFGGAAASVTPKKQQRIIKAALAYQQQNAPQSSMRFDVVAVEGDNSDNNIEIDWIKSAFDGF